MSIIKSGCWLIFVILRLKRLSSSKCSRKFHQKKCQFFSLANCYSKHLPSLDFGGIKSLPFEAFLGSFVVGEKFDEGFMDFLGPLSSCTAK